jgi:hypothetical protein
VFDSSKQCGACNELEAYWRNKVAQREKLDLGKMARDLDDCDDCDREGTQPEQTHDEAPAEP